MIFSLDSTVLIQGVMEPLAQSCATVMKAYGINIVAGVSVGNGGQQVDDIPVFDLVEQAVNSLTTQENSNLGKIDISLIFVPPYDLLDAALEAISAGIGQIILVTGGIPPLDTIKLIQQAQRHQTLILGPGSAGIMIPEQILWGTQNPQFFTPGTIGLLSSTNYLTQEIAWTLTQGGQGQSLVVNLGTDRIVGSDFQQWLQYFEQDEKTSSIVVIRQLHDRDESALANYISTNITKPVIVYLAGHQPLKVRTSRDMTSVIASQLTGTVTRAQTPKQVINIWQKAQIPVAKSPSQILELLQKLSKKKRK